MLSYPRKLTGQKPVMSAVLRFGEICFSILRCCAFLYFPALCG
nr:MAG TPA: hypothetical protein [Bacteriophage sp.]